MSCDLVIVDLNVTYVTRYNSVSHLDGLTSGPETDPLSLKSEL